MRHARLAGENGAEIGQFDDHLGLEYFLFAGPFLTLKRIDPGNVTHCRLYVFNVELIFERNRQAMQRTERLMVFGEVVLEFLRRFDRCLEKDLMQTAYLSITLSNSPRFSCSNSYLQVGEPMRLGGRKPQQPLWLSKCHMWYFEQDQPHRFR